MVQLQILTNQKMQWSGRKDRMGMRLDRHDLGRFVIRNTNRLPVQVLVSRLDHKRDFAFAPILVNGFLRNIVFTYKKYMLVVSFDDVAAWIKSYVTNNKLFEDERYHYNV